MKRVLVVDDDPGIHLIVTAALERAGGLQITFAHDGEQALDRIHSVRPDLILLDVNMPGIKGDDVMYEIRKDPELRGTPVVFVTGKDCAANFDYERFGAQGLITKPFDPARLAEEISAFLPLERPCNTARAQVEIDREAEEERRRAGFLARAFREIPMLEGQLKGKFDIDAAKRIIGMWQERAGRHGHPGILEVAQRIEELLLAGVPSAKRLMPLLEEASEAFRQAQRDEKWRLLDAEIESQPEPAEIPPSAPTAVAAALPGEAETVAEETPSSPGEAETVVEEAPNSPDEVETASDGAPSQPDEVETALDEAQAAAEVDAAPILRARQTEDDAAASVAPASEAGEIHVVVADDDPTILALVEATVSALGIVCHSAPGGVEALELLREIRPHAAILDVNMPQMDGFEVLAAMRDHEALSDTPVIMLTALRQEADVVRGFRLGADDYVVKPFNPMELSARLERLLRPRRGQGGGSCRVATG